MGVGAPKRLPQQAIWNQGEKKLAEGTSLSQPRREPWKKRKRRSLSLDPIICIKRGKYINLMIIFIWSQ
jgi:hypothetical protein